MQATDPGKWEKEKRRRREYHAANREQANERFRQFRATKPNANRNWRHNCEDWDALFAALWEAQGGKCYLCEDDLGAAERQVHLDHDHSCCPAGRSCEVCRRGLACGSCNVAIGYVLDDPDRLHRIADNLEAAKTLVRRRAKESDWEKRGVLFDLDESA